MKINEDVMNYGLYESAFVSLTDELLKTFGRKITILDLKDISSFLSF